MAYYLGAQKQQLADKTASLGMLLNMLHGLVLAAICIAVMPAFLGMFTKQVGIIGMGVQYSDIVFLFAVPNAAALCFEKIFQAVGRMKTSMFCMLLGCVTNIVLDPLLIFGIGIFPAMGIRGAALATGIGQIVSLAGYLTAYYWKPIPAKVKVRNMKPEKQLCKKVYSIGIPATLSLALPSVQVSALNAILAVYSASYVLVLGAYFKLQTFLYLTGNGVVQGMRPLIGYNYGAGESKRVKEIFRSALFLIVIVMVIGTILCMAVPQALIGLFTGNPETIRLGREALRLISIGFIVSSVSVTVSGALEGLGKGKESLVISLLRYIVVILPLAFVAVWLNMCYWICLGENGVNWFQFWIMSGFPFGIQKMLVLLIPRNFGIAGSIGVLALDAVIGGMIGVIVLAIKIIAIIREVINIIMELAGKRISC